MLNQEQIAFFKANGYLIVFNMLDPRLCERARGAMWAALPADCPIKRDDPATHVGPIPEAFVQDDAMHIRAGYRWQLRELGTRQFMIDLMYNDKVTTVAEDLLGEGMLVSPVVDGKAMGSEGPAWPGGPVDPAINEGVRGIYFTLPYGDVPRESDFAHTDGHPFNLGVVGLIADTPADGGAFKVWPGSHKRLYPTFQMQYDQPRIPFYEHLPSHKGIIHSDEYLKELDLVMQDTRAVDCWGKEGDVVFWHHRLAHMAGHNFSDVIRQAVLCDFSRTDLDTCRLDPPQDNMWRDWSEAVNECEADYSAEFARTQHLAI